LTAEWQSDESNAGKPFPSYARMLAKRGSPAGNSRHSWTIDFAERRAKARAEMQPLKDQASAIRDEVIDLKEALRRLKKEKAPEVKIEAMEARIREKDKAARDLEAQAAAIDAAVYDLKAVNPNVVAQVDERTPAQIIKSIHDQGRIVAEALARLNALMQSPANEEKAA
jgi:type I restriction enzyme M protein